jgi:phage tail-like protein
VPISVGNLSGIYAGASSAFHVQIGNVSEAMFTECSGLQAEVQVEEYAQGGENDTVHKLAGRVRYSNITLRRGVRFSDTLYLWWRQVLQGKITRKNVTILLFDPHMGSLMQWQLIDAFPVKWVAPQLRAADSSPAIESLELTFERLDYLM